jgi:hypothetical protein
MQHLREVKRGGGYLLHEVIKHYGIWDFEIRYIASVRSHDVLQELEKQLTLQYDSVENGFNQIRGGATGEAVGNPVIVNGKRFISLNAAARHYGIEEYAVHQRMKRYGYSLEEALELEVRQKQPPKTNPYEVDRHVYPNFTKACRLYGLEDSAVRSRLIMGWSERQAFGIEPSPKKGRNAYGKTITIDGTVLGHLQMLLANTVLMIETSPPESVGGGHPNRLQVFKHHLEAIGITDQKQQLTG